MEKLSFYEINRIFEDLNDRKSSDFEFDFLLDSDIKSLSDLKNQVNSKFWDELDRIGEFEIIETDDCEREGYNTEQIFRIIQFKDHDIYVKVKGYWSSYGGDKFESMKEVKPVTKTITVYE